MSEYGGPTSPFNRTLTGIERQLLDRHGFGTCEAPDCSARVAEQEVTPFGRILVCREHGGGWQGAGEPRKEWIIALGRGGDLADRLERAA